MGSHLEREPDDLGSTGKGVATGTFLGTGRLLAARWPVRSTQRRMTRSPPGRRAATFDSTARIFCREAHGMSKSPQQRVGCSARTLCCSCTGRRYARRKMSWTRGPCLRQTRGLRSIRPAAAHSRVRVDTYLHPPPLPPRAGRATWNARRGSQSVYRGQMH